uniref:Uncharacterized protein n=1 Tax=Acrobeloides nanus TaxID=290746 RepID=A0A914D9V1_9BILA
MLRSVKLEDLKCFSATPILTKDGFLLDCDNLDVARSIQWLYEGVAISHANVMEYEQLDNGSLVVKGKDLDPKDFSCAVNYLTSPSRHTRQLGYRPNNDPGHRTNSEGNTRPQFTYTPKDRSYRE